MRVRMTMLATSLAILGFLAIRGVAQDPAGTTQDPGLIGKAGHTLDEVGRGIKAEVKQVGEKLGGVGQGIKAEAQQVSSGVARRFDGVKADVNKMPIHHRVYSRIHWDTSLHDAKIEVHMLRNGVVLLRGSVPTEAAKKRAVELAMGTVDVTEVHDELTLPATATPPKSTASTRTSISR
jgi:osmotically-inducible protein OsmY